MYISLSVSYFGSTITTANQHYSRIIPILQRGAGGTHLGRGGQISTHSESGGGVKSKSISKEGAWNFF